MFEWIEDRWIITGALIIVGILVLDELAYRWWRKANPGSLYSHLHDRTITPVDPSKPPTTYYG